MKNIIFLTLLFILSSKIVFGHSDFILIKDFGNVKVSIRTGFRFEEINKSWIIGELAYKLCQQLNYTKPIFVDFFHDYVDKSNPNYFLSFDDGSKIEKWVSNPQPILKENGLVIREINRQFKPSITLKLLEYAIINMDKIKSTQKTIELNNSREWKIKTVDTLLVKKIAFGSISDLVKNVLMTKIYRTEDEKNISDISYYFNDSKYYIFYNSYKVKDSVLLIVDNIYQFKSIAFNKSIVFDTDSSFYLIQGAYDPRSSKRKVIENVYKNYRPFEISTIGSHKVTFSYWYYHYDEDSGMLQTKERNILYKSDTDELIQDLDNKLNGK